MSAHAIYGTGGFAREVLGPLKAMLAIPGNGQNTDQTRSIKIAFINDDIKQQGRQVHGQDVLSYEQARANNYVICIAIADGQIRKRIAQQIGKDGLSFQSITAATCVRYGNVAIGVGAILCDHVTITTDVTIGSHFHANIYSYVAHDCKIGDFVTFAPRVCCNGNVTIADGAYVGTGAVLRQGVSIGEGAIIGMGAVVTKDVAPGTTVIGNPARIMTR